MAAESLEVVAVLVSLFTAALLYIVFTKTVSIKWISPEAAVFRSQYVKLKAAIQSPEIVADELFAKGSIEFGIKEKVHLHTLPTSEKCEILLGAVWHKIIVDPNEFHVFISILQKEPATKNIADRLLRLGRNQSVKSIDGSNHKGSCSVILYVAAVGIALLLLSIIDVWKLKFGLAPYCITAGIGAFILAVMIKKSWMIQSLLLDTSTDKKHWKLKQLHHSGLCPEKGQESTDPMDSFSLPQCICVMVSNYQQLQAIFAIPKGECHTREIRPDEQFSPIVTIVDTATQQPLDCVLLLHGEKPPEVTCRTLFCYIAVKVTVFQDCDGHDSHPHPLYHIKSKPCKQGKLPLTFCFHQPGTVCVIQLSIHSIVDSEGVEYIRQSQDFTCTCLVHVIDRNQHSVVKVTGQHGVARIKEPPLLRYTGPLATTQYHKIETRFTKLFRTANHKHMQQLSKEVVFTSSSSPDIKVFALCWEALSEAVQLGNYVRAERLLRAAWKKATKLECANGLLLQGRVLRHVSFIQYEQNKDAKALEYMSQAKKILFLAAPSEETAHALYTELLVKKRKFFSTPNLEFFSQLLPFENECELLLEHAKYMEEYEKQAHCSFRMMKASFHLRSDLITNKLPPKEFWPSPDDLKKAEKCLENVGLNIMCQSNSYKARYFCTVCDLDIWKQKYNMAIDYLEEARKVSEMPCINQRFQLIERLKKR